MTSGSICILPYIQAVTGPASFQLRLKEGLERRGIDVHHTPQRADTRAILVIAGTRKIKEIQAARRRGVRVVQRLNGINWIQRRRRTGVRHFLRAELGNLLLLYTRRFLADGVVYQSQFTRDWWERVYGPTRVPAEVIWNGVDLAVFTPEGPETLPGDHLRVQVVEGNLQGGYEIGLEFALRFSAELQRRQVEPVELVVTGHVPDAVRQFVLGRYPQAQVRYTGLVASEAVPGLNRTAHLFFSAELLPSCPNAVIEALACGTPVVAFATGALPELVQGDAGRVVAFGGNPWNLDWPDFPAAASAAHEILLDRRHFSQTARRLAEDRLGLDAMTERYCRILAG